MNIVTQLQELDSLIIEHTKPPVTAILRNKLSLSVEQAEAHADAVAKQDQTLSRQIETIERLEKENADVQRELAEWKARNKKATDDWLRDKTENYRRLNRSRDLPSFNEPSR